jgi:steroid delta-isomerase
VSALARYARYFQSLTPDALGERFDEVFSEDVHFRDPFNDVRGREAARQVFRHMFEHTAMVRFDVLECVQQGEVGYLRWRFHFRLRGDRRDREPVEGVSRVVLAADGRVSEHLDYWDAAGGLYAQLPLLGALMRWLRKRLSAG